MKKLFITSFLAVTLSSAFYFIVLWEPESYNSNTSEKSIVLNEEKNKEEENKVENTKDNSTSKADLNKSDNDSEVKKNAIEEKEEKNNKTEEKTNNKIEEKEEQKEVVSSSVTIFNVKKEEIIDRLTFKEKTKLLSVANKMSAVDVERIKESLMTKSEKEGSAEALKVIKCRLTEEDYKEVKDILSPYINIDFLESIV